MRPLEEARAEVLHSVQVLDTEPVSIWDASGRVLAADVIAAENVPPFHNSAMDGYAVLGVDVARPGAVLDVIGDLAAGFVTERRVGPGQALKIMTGAPMPEGADTIVKIEDTDGGTDRVTIAPAVDVGTSVRAAGGDVPLGSLVFEAGTRLTPMHVGVLATIGVATPTVRRRPRVAFMSTGDELVPPGGGPLAPGLIRDSNRPMLKALLEDAGADLIDLGIIPDNDDALREALETGSSSDVIVSTGGVSMGDYDVTKKVLQGSSSVGFWQVAIQPAKPFAFGRVGDALVLRPTRQSGVGPGVIRAVPAPCSPQDARCGQSSPGSDCSYRRRAIRHRSRKDCLREGANRRSGPNRPGCRVVGRPVVQHPFGSCGR